MYAVLTDTSSNIPTQRAEAMNIHEVAYHYSYNEEDHDCLDTRKFNAEEYYELIRKGTKVTTSQINPFQYKEFFETFLKEGQDILFISMSSGISGSFKNALFAAEELREKYPDRKIHVIDSKGASLGEGLLAMKAAEYRDSGMEIDEAARLIADYAERMYQVFTVDDLIHLKRTGRLSNAVAVVGTLLRIKPILRGNESGKILFFNRTTGRKKAMEFLLNRYRELVIAPEEQIVGIAHAGCPVDAQWLAEKIKETAEPKEILIVDYEPVTGSHVGPGTLALFFASAHGVRNS